ncbi:MAG: PAS domain S-box protein, partial [Mariprofundaceae bacterium]
MLKTGLHSPLRLIITMMVMIFLAESFVMLLFIAAGYEITVREGLLDATLLSLLIAPGMYFVLFRPMREQQSQILRSQRWLKDITDHLPEALVSIDENGIVKSFNPAAEAMFDIPAQDVIGHSVNMLMSDEDAREHDRHIRRYMETGKSDVLGYIRELEARRSNGEMFPIELQVRELKSNHHTYFIGMIRDISDRRSEELRQERIKERIERAQRLESLGVLAGGIAHDFNNILSSMLGNAELLRIDLGALDGDAESCMQNIETGCNHAADLCRQMLAYAGKGRYVIESVNLSDLVLGMEKLVKVSVPKSIVVHKELTDNLPLIHADIAQMEQVVLNLLTNAAEAIGDANGEIHLSTGVQTLADKDLHAFEGAESMQPGDFVYLQVQDSGCGIRPEDMAHLFEPFFTTKFTGRGLGMSAILGILRSHGGGIHIDSVPDEGTTIRVLMPAQAEAVAKPAVQSKS